MDYKEAEEGEPNAEWVWSFGARIRKLENVEFSFRSFSLIFIAAAPCLFAATPIAYYYLLPPTIYQAPPLSTVIQSRLLTSLFQLSSAFDLAKDNVEFEVGKGFSWKDRKEKTEKKEEEVVSKELAEFRDRFGRKLEKRWQAKLAKG